MPGWNSSIAWSLTLTITPGAGGPGDENFNAQPWDFAGGGSSPFSFLVENDLSAPGTVIVSLAGAAGTVTLTPGVPHALAAHYDGIGTLTATADGVAIPTCTSATAVAAMAMPGVILIMNSEATLVEGTINRIEIS